MTIKHNTGMRRTALSALLTAMVLTACAGEKPEVMLASARDYLAKGDRSAAVIQIKNALQGDPSLPEARFLLGQALLEDGNAVAAEVELRKALDLKYQSEQVSPLLAKALVLSGKYQKVTEDFANASLAVPAQQADLKTTVGVAYAALGQPEPARKHLDDALGIDPQFAPALLAKARLNAAEGKFEDGKAIVEQVLAKEPKNHDALKLKADISRFLGDIDGAVAAYKESLVARPDFIAARIALMTVHLQQNKLEDAEKDLVEIRKQAAQSPQTTYLAAQLAYQKKNFKGAKELGLKLLQVAPDNANVLQLMGAIEFQTGALLAAEDYLSKALQGAPQLALARRLLIASYLRSGQAAKALTALEPVKGNIDTDADMLSLAGQVYLQNGDVEQAEKAFAKATKLDPKDARKRTSLALTHMMTGKADAAFEELQDVAATDPGNTADLALISAHLRQGDLDKALKAIDSLAKKQPENPLVPTLKGRALAAKKDLAGAQASFEKALSLNATYFPAASSLAAIDLSRNKPDDARKRFEAILAVEPKNGQALVALAELKARTGGSADEIASLLGKAVSANPTDPSPRLLLIELHLRNKDAKKATSVAQDALSAIPDDPALLSALGRAQLIGKEVNQAITSFNRLAALQPTSPQPHLMLAEAHMAEKNKFAAEQSLKKALEIKPDFVEAQRGLIMLQLDAGNIESALAEAKRVQKQRPKEAIGFALEGDINMTRKDLAAAETAYRSGLKLAPSSELAVKLHSVLLTSGKNAEASKFASGWTKDHGNDIAFLFYLGDRATRDQAYDQASRYYRAVLEAQPKHAAALNNLAWIAGKLKDPKAVEYAEKANELAPNQPAFMDTLAMLLADRGDNARALPLLQKALELQPQAAAIRLNYAKVLIQSGDPTKAKKELAELAALGDKFPGQAEVARLSKGL